MASPEWKVAIEAEHRAIVDNGTYHLVPLPPGCKPIKTRWMFKIKHKAVGSVDRYKARWIAGGFTQSWGINYDETFSPVVRKDNLHTLLALALIHGIEIHQLDFDTAFLNAELEEEIYITQPEGFIDPEHPDHVCRLCKSLYGLKQAPREWYKLIDNHLNMCPLCPLLT